jgi:hypothetical protein
MRVFRNPTKYVRMIIRMYRSSSQNKKKVRKRLLAILGPLGRKRWTPCCVLATICVVFCGAMGVVCLVCAILLDTPIEDILLLSL